MTMTTSWKLPLGANLEDHGVTFRVWAPKCQQIDVVIENGEEKIFSLNKENNGYFTGFIPDLKAGALYRYRINQDQKFPDPCSRFQPEGPHGPSLVVDPYHFQWHDQDWPGVEIKGQVLYEMHIGAYTPEGTFDRAAQELEELKRLGITLLEIMPIAEFPGRWNQGYDGVSLYAPSHLYGDYEGFKRFVDKAHSLGLGVILDVVYNHFGPDGNYTGMYSDDYLSNKHHTAWGSGLNYDGPNSREVREFVIQNSCYWINEFHVDGLRIDSTQDINDDSPVYILAELSQRVRQIAEPKKLVLIAENEPQDIKLIRPINEGGDGLDGVWNDDFHHSAMVAFKGRTEGYYTDYKGKPQEFISLYKRGYLYQGQAYAWHAHEPRGKIVEKDPASAFVFYLQNHDQVANELRGERIHHLISPSHFRVLTALLLLAPETPLIFMGQEFGSSNPFLFFADHESKELFNNVWQGRQKFMEQFPRFASAYQGRNSEELLPSVWAKSSFDRSKLDLSEREKHKEIYTLHYDLLKIRREDPVISQQDRFNIDGAVLDTLVFIIRYFGHQGDDRLMVVNFGGDFDYAPIPEPLLAPSQKGAWELIWSTDDPVYGGPGIISPYKKHGWKIPAQSVILLKAVESKEESLNHHSN